MTSCFRCIKRQSSSEEKNNDSNARISEEVNDPRIPLNARQKFSLIKNWKGISREAAITGATMFLRLFEKDDELFDLFNFGHLRKASKEDQLENELLQNHGKMVMNIYGEAIQSVENADTFFAVLEYYGKAHAQKKGFRPEYFKKMEEPFLYAVKTTLGDRYTDNMDVIYRTITPLILNTMEKNCKEEFERQGIELNDVKIENSS